MPEPLEFVREISRMPQIASKIRPRVAAAYTHLEVPLKDAYLLAEETLHITNR